MIRALRCVAYALIMCAASVALGSCASPYVPLTAVNVVPGRGGQAFTDEQIDLIILAANAWIEAIPEARMPAGITSDIRGGTIAPARGKVCEGSRVGATSLSPTVAPRIIVCVDDLDPEDALAFYIVVLHEIGHALSLRGDHLPSGNVMHSRIEPSLEGAGLITAEDIAYVREGMGL